MLPKRSIFWTQIDSTPQIALNFIKPLRILTESVFDSAEAMHDPIPDTSLHISNSRRSGWDIAQVQRWSGLSTAYASQQKYTTALRAERIGKQILFCRDTLFALQRSYLFTMGQNLPQNQISYPHNGTVHFMSDKYSTDIGYRTQSCLNELYALRDFLLYFLFEDMYQKKGIGIRKGLELLRNDDKFHLHSLLSLMLSDTAPIGPIALISLYRNVFFHFMGAKNNPLGQAYCFHEIDSMFGHIPYLIYPLYDNVTRLRAIERGAPLDEGTKDERNIESQRFMQLHRWTRSLLRRPPSPSGNFIGNRKQDRTCITECYFN
jgi:hypothetical protein